MADDPETAVETAGEAPVTTPETPEKPPAAASEPKPNGGDPAPAAEPGPPSWDTMRAAIQDQKLRDHAGRFTTAEDLARSHLDLRQKLSKMPPSPPGKDATEEDVNKYLEKIGVPSDGQYQWDLPEGRQATDVDKQLQGEAGKLFRDARITADQQKVLNTFWNERVAALAAGEMKKVDDWLGDREAALKKEWAGDYDANIKRADASFSDWAAKAGVSGDEIDAITNLRLEGGGLVGGIPQLRKMFATISRQTGESDGLAGMPTSERKSLEEKRLDHIEAAQTAKGRGDDRGYRRHSQQAMEIADQIYGTGAAPGTGSPV